MRPIPAETCKRLHAVPASYFFFAKLRSFGAKSVKIAYFLRIFNDFVIQILILTFVVDFGAILGSYIFRPISVQVFLPQKNMGNNYSTFES